ncbi:hypothetical protein FSP39_012129 [Pinctada imbricata]|uniref:L-Fucosyltransferase n=1 Tax=Pinctada imbricata TaxID=66713 RepID=A0AA88Y3H9_PINIB|nr:hypothetical protein FSP39_012129 [Pinctada imbricata]
MSIPKEILTAHTATTRGREESDYYSIKVDDEGKVATKTTGLVAQNATVHKDAKDMSMHSKFENQSPLEFRNSHFMTISGQGRLGNKMFEFASLLGIAYRHNYTPYILQRHPLHNTFEIPKENIRSLPKLDNVISIGEGAAGKYFVKTENLTHDKNYTLGGYYQSWKYFDFVSDLVRKSFKFKSQHERKAKIAIETYARGNRPSVGVHVRRSDMASTRELRRGYNVAPKSYFQKAFEFFRKNLTDPVFLIISDDLRWSKANLQAEDVSFVSTGDPGADLAILASCNHSIVSTGSFGWWGGYLSGGTVVYFSNFPARDSWLAGQYDKKDYYPPRWIAME